MIELVAEMIVGWLGLALLGLGVVLTVLDVRGAWLLVVASVPFYVAAAVLRRRRRGHWDLFGDS